MTTLHKPAESFQPKVVEAYRLDRYDNLIMFCAPYFESVVEAYRLDRYDNFIRTS